MKGNKINIKKVLVFMMVAFALQLIPITNVNAGTSELTELPSNAIKFKFSDAMGDFTASEWKDPATGISATVEYSYDNVTWYEIDTSIDDENLGLVNLTTSKFYAFLNTNKVYLKVNWTGDCNVVSAQFAGFQKNVVYELTQKADDYFYHINRVSNKYSLNWAYDNSFGEDANVTNGTVKVIDIDGVDKSNDPSNDSGYWRIEKDNVVTVKLIPNYGYQLDSAGLNGATLVAGSYVSTFTFTMPQTNLHFAAMFKATADKITVNGTDVEAASVDGAENIVSTGNIELRIDDLDISEDMETEFKEQADGNVIVSYLDLNIYNIVYKDSNGNEVWEEELTDLDEEITVVLTLADDLTIETGTYYLIREHNGVYENIEVEYDTEANTLTFNTDKFSEYALVLEAEENPNTFDGITAYYIIGGLSIIGLLGTSIYLKKQFN